MSNSFAICILFQNRKIIVTFVAVKMVKKAVACLRTSYADGAGAAKQT